jgi:hypothetical protein
VRLHDGLDDSSKICGNIFVHRDVLRNHQAFTRVLEKTRRSICSDKKRRTHRPPSPEIPVPKSVGEISKAPPTGNFHVLEFRSVSAGVG